MCIRLRHTPAPAHRTGKGISSTDPLTPQRVHDVGIADTPQGAVNSLAPQPVDSSRGVPILSPCCLTRGSRMRDYSAYLCDLYRVTQQATDHTPHHSQPATPASRPRPLDLMGASHPKGAPHNRPHPKPTPAPATNYPAPLDTAASPTGPAAYTLPSPVCPAALTRGRPLPPSVPSLEHPARARWHLQPAPSQYLATGPQQGHPKPAVILTCWANEYHRSITGHHSDIEKPALPCFDKVRRVFNASAPGGSRTHDQEIRRLLLYPLSY